jgi:hypothetical protein
MHYTLYRVLYATLLLKKITHAARYKKTGSLKVENLS